jgi:hypothetical protein
METHELALTTGVWKIGHRRQVLLCLSVVLVLVLSLASIQAGAQEKQAAPNPPQPAVKVIILPPQVVFEQLTAYSRGHNFGGVSFEPALFKAANTILSTQGYTVVMPESLQDNTNAIDWLTQLQPLTSRLSRGVINDEARQIFSHLGTLPENYLIFIQFMRIKEGPGGSWDPNTGAITSQMSSTILQAALISPRTGQVVWKNDVLERSVFRADSPKFTKSVNLLYSTLSTKGGN